MMNQAERLEALTDRLEARLDYEDGCWIWNGPVNKGYGKMTYRQGKSVKVLYVHRAMYERHVGPIPDGMQIHHLCFNKRCARPTHLKLVSLEANLEANKELWSEAAARRRAELLALP